MLLVQSLIAKLPELLDESVRIIDCIEYSLTTKATFTVHNKISDLNTRSLDKNSLLNVQEDVIVF